jgi:hypothetical protein
VAVADDGHEDLLRLGVEAWSDSVLDRGDPDSDDRPQVLLRGEHRTASYDRVDRLGDGQIDVAGAGDFRD